MGARGLIGQLDMSNRHLCAARVLRRAAMLATLETYHDAGRLSRVERAELLAEAREVEAEAERLERRAARIVARREAECGRRRWQRKNRTAPLFPVATPRAAE